ncbi:DUF916 domain-containing protein [Weissella confusa]|uniref:DUF916 domain-containing protein n=1 Tax=Weissella confusa TaxID=1583 RepID=UPI0018F2516B|nr:DUF916 and DUF3324 domain-containing protein [Weissella confusa]MBJ7618541.1 DUF916 and DUF3324 domain-containing protein [Weissella confusa]MBJ7624556.1 DUF916 and DUF3324 domain-containing protein [Weissella confusa]MBJ7651049.1 DUF916 and DUF3324 domain-containing protein [Weissella confusa]MBJ7657121.1 DUF916 and DUF3324 domain-containing protein [Weissella confusa]MBJ7665167.1 DUF916 and DUF3324 domain-containing protein [Weissella confusa]
MKRKVVLIAALLLGAVVMFPTQANAADANLKVTPVQVPSQRDKEESFFDLVLQPGQSETLTVQLQNPTKKDMVVDATVAPASTSDSGSVQYTNQVKLDPSLAVNVKDLVEAPKKVTVPAGQTITYSAELTMPTTSLTGMTAGALIFAPEDSTKSSAGQGMGIINKFQYAVAVLARNENTTWDPALTIDGATAKNQEGATNIAVHLRNTAATYLNQLAVETTVSRNGKTYSRSRDDMQMAPNSDFNFSVPLKDNVTAGQYSVATTAYYVKDPAGQYQDAKGQHYKFKATYDGKVNVTAKKAQSLNRALKQAKGGMPTMIKVGITAIVVLAALVLVMVIMMMKRRKKESNRLADLEAELQSLKAQQK